MTQVFTIERPDFTLPANTSSTVACAADIVAPSVPVVTDNCGNVLVASAPSISASPTCEGNVTYTYTFTDCEGNTHNWIHTFTIEHSDFTLPANTTSTVACAADIVAPTVPVVTDNCGNVLVASAPSISASPTCEGNVTYTYTFTDCEGNTHNWIHTFTIEHSDFTLPANTTSTVACAADIVAPTVPVVTDNCGNVLVASAPSISANPTCEGNVTYTYTFTDCEGNSHNWIHTFTIEHSDFTLPANTISTVACAADIVAPSVPVVTDNCGNVLVASAPSISASPTCEGNVTYTYTFTDCEGNTHNWIHTFTIEHSDFTLPANTTSTVACAADIVAPTVPVVTDNCGNVLVASAPSISASPTCEGNVTYTYTFTDCEGNTHNWIHTFTIENNDFTLPANTASTVACAADIVAPTVPVVTDNCGNVLVASAPSISANPTCEGNVTYTYTFTDCEGNSHNWIHTFTIENNDFTLPANTASTVACAADIVAPTVPVVTDNCGNVLVASAPSISASPTCEGNVTYTYTFTDCEGNSHNWIHTFTIEHSDFTLPANTTSTVACAADIVAPSVPVVTDNCGNVLVASAPSISASPTCEGNVTYTYTFTDCEGNSHNWIHTFTIEHSDFTLPANTSSTVACAADIVAPSVPVVTDNCGNVLVASAPSISASPTCEGNVTYTYTFTDCEGNTHNWIHTFTIDDTSPPTGIAPSDILDLQCTSEIPVADINLVTDVADNCNGTVTVTVSETNNEGSGCNGNPLIITRTYTLTDCSGLTTNLIQTIRVEDNTAPIFTSELPQDISVSCDAIPNPAEMTGSDNCGDVTITVLDTIDREESQCAGEYIISRTWTITDSCNNSSSYTQTITVFDNTPPILSTPLDTEISVSCSEIPAVPELEFSDNCSGIQDVVYNETSTIISIYAYVIVREWVVSDNCGNEASFTQTINVSVEEPFDAIPFAICIEDDPIDLFTILDDSIPTTGEWHEVTSSGGLTGSIFDPTNVTLGFYTLQYVVELGDNTCPMIYEVYLNVNDDCVVLAACDITVYNAVSPNDDGSNDFFFIDGLECYPDNTVEIYNRWGILVYDERGYDNNLKSFKGISEGRSTVNKNELLPDGTYFYILKYTDEENKKHDRSGYLYLNR